MVGIRRLADRRYGVRAGPDPQAGHPPVGPAVATARAVSGVSTTTAGAVTKTEPSARVVLVDPPEDRHRHVPPDDQLHVAGQIDGDDRLERSRLGGDRPVPGRC